MSKAGVAAMHTQFIPLPHNPTWTPKTRRWELGMSICSCTLLQHRGGFQVRQLKQRLLRGSLEKGIQF